MKKNKKTSSPKTVQRKRLAVKAEKVKTLTDSKLDQVAGGLMPCLDTYTTRPTLD
jgi:hypothetical protein